MMFDTIEKAGRFYVMMGCSREETIPLLEDDFPDDDATAAYDAALIFRDEQRVKLQAALDAEDANAVASEHDLDVSMHRGWTGQ